MINEFKHVDPIIFGVIQDPTKEYNKIEDRQIFGISTLTENLIDNVDTLNLGDMFKIAEWA